MSTLLDLEKAKFNTSGGVKVSIEEDSTAATPKNVRSQTEYSASEITALGSSTDLTSWKEAYADGMLCYIYKTDFTDEFPQKCYYTHKSLGDGFKCLLITKTYATHNNKKVIVSEIPSVEDWTFDSLVTGALNLTLGTVTSPNPSNAITVGTDICTIAVTNSGGGSVNISLSGTNASLYTLRNVTDGITGSDILYDASKTFVLETSNDYSGADYSHSVTITATNNLYGNTASGNVNTSGTFVANVFRNKRALVSSTQTGNIRNYILTGTNKNPFADDNNFPALTDGFSISFWLKISSTDTKFMSIVAFSGTDTRNHMKIFESSGSLVFSLASEDNVGINYSTSTTPFANDTSWKHVVITKKSGSVDLDNSVAVDGGGTDKYVHIWIDGSEVGTVSTQTFGTGSFSDNDWASESASEVFLFGRSRALDSDGGAPSNGYKQNVEVRIDELAFFNKELNDSEVGSVYNLGTTLDLMTLAGSFNLAKYFRFGDHASDVTTFGSMKFHDEVNDTVYFAEDVNTATLPGVHVQGSVAHLSALNDPPYKPATSDQANLKFVRSGDRPDGAGNFDVGIFKMPVNCKMQTDWSMSFWFNTGSSNALSLSGVTGIYVNLGFQSSGSAAKHSYFSGHRLSGFLWSYRGSNASTDVFINAMGESISSGSFIKLDSPSTFPIMDNGNWHHVAITWNGTGTTSNVTNAALLSNVKLYINGNNHDMAADSSVNGDLPASQILDTIQMGGVLLTGQEDKAFNFDELAFWNGYELSQSDVETLYNNGSPANVLTQLSSNQPDRYVRFETSTLTFDTKSQSSPTGASANQYVYQDTH